MVSVWSSTMAHKEVKRSCTFTSTSWEVASCPGHQANFLIGGQLWFEGGLSCSCSNFKGIVSTLNYFSLTLLVTCGFHCIFFVNALHNNICEVLYFGLLHVSIYILFYLSFFVYTLLDLDNLLNSTQIFIIEFNHFYLLKVSYMFGRTCLPVSIEKSFMD